MPRPTLYRDFTITIHPRQGRGYPLTVDSPAGNGDGLLELDFNELNLGWTDVGQAVTRGRAGAPDLRTAPVEALGDKLFRALFTGQVKTLWDQSLGQMQAMTYAAQMGLRIKLQVNPEASDMTRILGLPWEYLYKKETREYLNLSPQTPIVRYLSVARPIFAYPLNPPLRVLVVISGATSDASRYPALQLEKERKLIEAALAATPQVELEFLEQATFLALRARLLEKDYHVLHFMGHGDFDQDSGKGVLLFEDPYGDPRRMSGVDLAIQLNNIMSLRLVVLNACESARMSEEIGKDPFGGVAAALVMCGLPAVIAMQYPISDRAALIFSGAFYRQLAAGAPVDRAATEGRLAVHGEQPTWLEWGTPVVFMRTDDGSLFSFQPAADRGSLPASPPPASHPAPPPPAEALSPLEAALLGCCSSAWAQAAASIPEADQAGAAAQFNRLTQTLVRFSAEDDLVAIKRILIYIARWPGAKAAVQELLQEPIVQRRVRMAGARMLLDFQRLAFEV